MTRNTTAAKHREINSRADDRMEIGITVAFCSEAGISKKQTLKGKEYHVQFLEDDRSSAYLLPYLWDFPLIFKKLEEQIDG